MVEEDDPDQVKNPADERAEEDPNDREDQVEPILVADRSADTVDRPKDIDYR